MKVVVTGAAGQIAYSLVPFLCEEGIFNSPEKIDLNLVENISFFVLFFYEGII